MGGDDRLISAVVAIFVGGLDRVRDLVGEVQLSERLLVAAGVGPQREMERTKGFSGDRASIRHAADGGLFARAGVFAFGVLAAVEAVEGSQPLDVAAFELGVFVLPAAGGLEVVAVGVDLVDSAGVFRAVSDADLGVRRRDSVL